MLRKINFRNFFYLTLCAVMASCAHNQTRDIAAIPIPKTIFAEIKVASSLFDDAVKLQIDDIFRNETSLSKLKNLGNGKSAEFTLSGAKAGNKVSFVKEANGEYSLAMLNNGKKTVLGGLRLNFNLTQAEIKTAANKYVLDTNGKVEVVYSKPGTKGSAELVRETDESFSGGAKLWANQNEFANTEYFKSITKRLFEDKVFSAAEKKLLANLLKLEFQAVTLACGDLKESSKGTIANMLEGLVNGSTPPQEFRSLLAVYASEVKITDPEVAKQLLELIKKLDCGLNVAVFK